MSPTMHSILSPSSMGRIINCPPSARINAEAPSTSSVYADEGTIAHALCEEYARAHFAGVAPDPDVIEASAMAIAELRVKYPGASIDDIDTMRGHAQTYLDHLKAIAEAISPDGAPYVTLEQRLSMDEWAPGCYGTSDCIMVGGNTLAVVDFKYGQGVEVEAEGNPQMRTYALGALSAYSMIYDIQRVEMYIIQPRICAEPKYAVMAVDELIAWGTDVLAPATKKALDGTGEYASGPWCKFCAIASTCRARAERYTQELAGKRYTSAKPATLTPDEIGEAIRVGEGLAEWLKDVQGYALRQCLDGVHIPGYKAIAGRLGNRSWTNAESAFSAMIQAGVPEEMLYERVPKSLSKIEKDCFESKKAFSACVGTYVTQAPGNPKLAPESDKHPAITARPTVEDDFG